MRVSISLLSVLSFELEVKSPWACFEAVMEHITAENYEQMRKRVCKLEMQDTVTGSSNFGRFMELFESSDAKWIDRINEVLEG